MAMIKYCRCRNKEVKIADGIFHYVCEESYPTSGACMESKCVYHNVMGMASSVFGITGGNFSASREDFLKIALTRLGAKDHCD